jgi:heme-degrading monooxygenase HmoA
VLEIIWEYVVREGAAGQFELTYGPGGAWSRIFGDCQGYRGTTVLRDIENPLRYLVIDLWESEADRVQALVDREAEMAALATTLRDWTESMTEVGSFRIRTQATVRPQRIAGRSTGRSNRRRRGR